MIETFLIALCSLFVALYIQARLAAREIRRNRIESPLPPAQNLILKRRV